MRYVAKRYLGLGFGVGVISGVLMAFLALAAGVGFVVQRISSAAEVIVRSIW